jgi:hypothetical protein
VQRTCFYHGGCPDGFGAAWSVWRAWGDEARYVACGHEDVIEAEDHAGEIVAFVDIAPRNETLRELAGCAEQLIVLDHHVSARDRLARDPGLSRALAAAGHHIRHDLDHSGAVLAWHHFHPAAPPPELLLYVEDQDLWNWKLPRSEEVNAAIGSYPRDFETWDALALEPAARLASEGEPILRAQRMEVERCLRSAHPIAIADARAEAVNSPSLRSSIGHELAKRAAYGRPWGIVYRLSGARVDVSIYSIGDLDVAEIAGRYGGGGHRNAAGFSVSLRDWQRRFL